MRKQFLVSLRALTLLLVMCLSIGNVWGGTEVTFTSSSYSSKKITDGIKVDKITFKGDKGTNSSSSPTYNSTGSAFRFYGGNNLVITPDNGCGITKIVITTPSSSNNMTSSNSSVSTGTLSVKSGVGTVEYTTPVTSAITFTNTASSGHWRVSQIVVTYSSGTPLTSPSSLTVGTITGTTAELLWKAGDADNTQNYIIEYKQSDVDDWIEYKDEYPTGTSCTLVGLTPSTSYNWRVSAEPTDAAKTSGKSTSNPAEASSTFTTAEPATFTIKFFNNGVQIGSDVQVTEGNKIGDNLPSDPTSFPSPESNVFAGWTTETISSAATSIDVDKVVDYYTVPTGDMDVNALWAAKNSSATASFAAAFESSNDDLEWTNNDITFGFDDGSLYTSNNPYTFSITKGDHYFFVQTEDQMIEKLGVTLSSSTYKIDEVSNGDLSISSNTQTVEKVNTNLINGYPTSSNQIRITVLDVYTYTKYLTSYASQTSVTYSANGKTLSSSSPALPTDANKYDKDADITLSTTQLKSDLYNFLGWNTDASATTAISTTTVKATGSDMTFYAIWSDRTLSSVAVSGAPTKKNYEGGEALDPTGLVVTGTYSNETQATITEGISWTFDPATLIAGNTTCDVKATVSSIESPVYQITGLTVVAPIVKYNVSITQPAKATIAATPSLAAENDDVTLSYNNVADHYHFVSWSVLQGETLVTVTNNVFKMPAGDVAVSATFEENAKCTVTFTDGVHDTDCSSFDMNNYEGTQIVFQSLGDKTTVAPTGDCLTDHYHFIGWIQAGTTPVLEPSNIIPVGTTTISIGTSDVTYNAVWVKETNE